MYMRRKIIAMGAALLFLADPLIAQNAVEVGAGLKVTINKHGTCRVIGNTGSVNFMVPTQSATEWVTGNGAFLAASRPNTTVAACGPATHFVNGYRYRGSGAYLYPWAGYKTYGSDAWLNTDGSRLAVSDFFYMLSSHHQNANHKTGRVEFYDVSATGSLTKTGEITSDNRDGAFGMRIALNEDMTRIVTGSRIYHKTGASWSASAVLGTGGWHGQNFRGSYMNKSGDRVVAMGAGQITIAAWDGTSWVQSSIDRIEHGYARTAAFGPTGEVYLANNIPRSTTGMGAAVSFTSRLEKWVFNGSAWQLVENLDILGAGNNPIHSISISGDSEVLVLGSNPHKPLDWNYNINDSEDPSNPGGSRMITYHKSGLAWVKKSEQFFSSLGLQPLYANYEFAATSLQALSYVELAINNDGTRMVGIADHASGVRPSGTVIHLSDSDGDGVWDANSPVMEHDYSTLLPRAVNTIYEGAGSNKYIGRWVASEDLGRVIVLNDGDPRAQGSLLWGSAYLFDFNE